MVDDPQPGRVVIAGGSGFLGISLAAHLAALGRRVVLLSRRPLKPTGPWRHVSWDARTPGDWCQELEGAAGLINLAGRTVDCVKTPDHQDEILRSRVEATRVLGVAVRRVAAPPPVWVQMSTAHIYGDPPDVICSEGSPFGYGLAPFVGRAWEEAFGASVLPSQQAVILRTSFVLGRDRGAGCGALARLSRLARLGLGGTVGSGTQGISWIHGAAQLAHELAPRNRVRSGRNVRPLHGRIGQGALEQAVEVRLVGVPIGLPAAAWMVRFAARWLLRTDPDLALYGRYVVSRRLSAEGFEFRFPEVRQALDDILRRRTAGD